MVVEYPSGGEGSCLSFFTLTPFVLLKYRGSVVPMVFPQICLAVGLSYVAKYLDDTGQNPLHDTDQPVSLGILVTFLLVFKTQNSYGQFWQALTALDGVLQTSRVMALMACTMFNWELEKDKSDKDVKGEVKLRARRILRLLVLHFFLIVEYLQRSGSDAKRHPAYTNLLRADIRRLAGVSEFRALYPEDEDPNTPGSESKHECANPMMVLFWMQLGVGRVENMGGCQPFVESGFINHVHTLMKELATMDKIDKTQFPLPYAQIVKILVIVWVFSLPFFLIAKSGSWTPLISALAALGFFGLDEVAEILESPFGTDPNDIELRVYAGKLMSDLEMMCNGRDTHLDTVISDGEDLDFKAILEQHFSRTPSSSSIVRAISNVSFKSKKTACRAPSTPKNCDSIFPAPSPPLDAYPPSFAGAASPAANA